MKVAFLSGKMAKSHTNGNWLVALADRDTGRLCGLGGMWVWRGLGSKGRRTRLIAGSCPTCWGKPGQFLWVLSLRFRFAYPKTKS